MANNFCSKTEKDDAPKKSFKFLRLPQIMEESGLSKPTIYRLMKLGKFPKARLLGERSVGWRDDEYLEWKQSREIAA